MSTGLSFRTFVQPLKWLDGTPLASNIEPYRWRLFDQAFTRRNALAFQYSLVLSGRAKKNWKTADLIFAALYALMDDSPGGNQIYLVANDAGQAADDLTLAKKLVKANPLLIDWLDVKKNIIERRDGDGFIEVLPAQDAIGSHGKTYRLLGIDEIHGYRNWDLLEALAADPTRPDCQQWITSYASIFHRPGAPLFDLLQQARDGSDPRLLFSWYGADFTTDPDVAETTPEQRANPSMGSWGDDGAYLAEQQRRLPAHKYRRLHLNLPGLPEGSAFQPEPVMDAFDRSRAVRPPEAGVTYGAFLDMSGGSNDDAVLAVAHKDADGCAIVDRVLNQGPQPPFAPRAAIQRFVGVLRDYRISRVVGDRYAGETFRTDFRAQGIEYDVAEKTASQFYEALEPRINGHAVVLPHVPLLEQQLLGLVWRGGKITHSNGEHDDWANSVAGVVDLVLAEKTVFDWRAAGMSSPVTFDLDDAWGPHGRYGHLPAEVRQREREAQGVRRKIGWEHPSGVGTLRIFS